ncbi:MULTISPECIES: hypothetical protein [unclassified Paenibacillus]|uniref:hypothetical protein n=1 Tax=unclassified Paenibacillus TaxID=185978 RepID=UPI00070ACF27|nr:MULTISPECIES: hypothetical protein [unclassified Paenibacillus]KQX48549.1 hypothetical protein ASD40_10160 [Paenibacillus sp. Root444D2]KRE49827.1 hypothetical protein ASG85_23430 [Paenibacillus sp. Soil724D2]
MGSRLMHLIIAEIVASSLDIIKNKREFLIGSIAPDAAISFERKVKDDYSLGYLTHLISDNVWSISIIHMN